MWSNYNAKSGLGHFHKLLIVNGWWIGASVLGKSPLWRWYDIANWLYAQNKLDDIEIIEHAKFIENINAVLIGRDPATKSYRQKLRKRLN